MFHAMVFVTIKVYTLYTGSTLTPNSPLLIIQHAFHVSASKTTLIGWVNRPTMHQETHQQHMNLLLSLVSLMTPNFWSCGQEIQAEASPNLANMEY